MAEIHLGRHELEQGALPAVCAVCGADQATPVKTKLHVQVAENPLFRTLRVQDTWLPCCPRHQWHFYRRQIHIFLGALCMAMFLPCLGLTVLVLGPFLRKTSFGWVFAIVSLVVPVLVGWGIMYMGRFGNTEAGDITDAGVLMTNVADRFVDAVKGSPGRKGNVTDGSKDSKHVGHRPWRRGCVVGPVSWLLPYFLVYGKAREESGTRPDEDGPGA